MKINLWLLSNSPLLLKRKTISQRQSRTCYCWVDWLINEKIDWPVMNDILIDFRWSCLMVSLKDSMSIIQGRIIHDCKLGRISSIDFFPHSVVCRRQTRCFCPLVSFHINLWLICIYRSEIVWFFILIIDSFIILFIFSEVVPHYPEHLLSPMYNPYIQVKSSNVHIINY